MQTDVGWSNSGQPRRGIASAWVAPFRLGWLQTPPPTPYRVPDTPPTPAAPGRSVSPARALNCREGRLILADGSGVSREDCGELGWDFPGPHILPHQPKWPRGGGLTMAGGQVKAGGRQRHRVHEADSWVELLFREPSRGERKKGETLEWRLKTLLLCFQISLYFGSPTFPSFRIWRSDRLPSKGNQKYRLCLAQPLLRISYKSQCNSIQFNSIQFNSIKLNWIRQNLIILN